MKIAVYDPYLDSLGGGEKYMMTAAECLSKKHEVTVLWDNETDIEKVEDRFGLDLSKVAVEPNFFSSKTSFWNRLAKSRKYDAIFYLSDGSIPIVASKKLVLHLQFPIEWVQVDMKTKLKIKRVNAIIVNSNFTKNLIDKKLGVNSKLVYPPVLIKKREEEKENMILHIGRFMKTGVEGNDYKKQYFMIDTFKKMINEGLKDWKFVIGASVKSADLADFQKMQATAAGYPISFVVNATNEELWKWYNKAKIYWHASGFGEDLKKNPERAEHFGISTVEAMGAGAVPVVINAGGQKEIVNNGENGFLWDTQQECIDNTSTLINDKKLYRQLQVQAEKDAEKFGYEKFSKELLSCF